MLEEEEGITDLNVNTLELWVVDMIDKDEVRIDLDSTVFSEDKPDVKPLFGHFVVA